MTEDDTSPAAPVLRPGDAAPGFTLPDVNGNPVRLADFRGRRVAVYFYPKAFTPGCTTQSCDFRDRGPDLDAKGLAVIGISRDEPSRLAEFAAEHGLTQLLLSDPDRAVHARYGVLGRKIVDGVATEKVRRSTFVIAADGTIEQALYDVAATDHVRDLLATL
jgi:peroxiredoxin Q/BCP